MSLEQGHRRTHPITPLVSGWKIVVGVIALLTAQNLAQLANEFTILRALIGLLLLIGAVVVSILLSALWWWRTTYAVTPEGVALHTGLLTRTQRFAPQEKIESVSVERPLLARLLGLAKVRVEIAGGGESYLDIEYVRSAEAEQMRLEILQVAAGAGAAAAAAGEAGGGVVAADGGRPWPGGGAVPAAGVPGAVAPDAYGATEADGHAAPADPATGVHVPGWQAPAGHAPPEQPPSWQSPAGQPSGWQGSAGQAAAGQATPWQGPAGQPPGSRAPGAQQPRTDVHGRLRDGVNDGALIAEIPTQRLLYSLVRDIDFIIGAVVAVLAAIAGVVILLWEGGPGIGAFVALIPAAIAVPRFVFGKIESGWGFVSRMTERGLRMRRGLLNTRTDNIAPGRVQSFEVRRPLLWRAPRWTGVTVSVAGIASTEENGAQNALPVGTDEELRLTLGHLAAPLGTGDDMATIDHLLNARARDIDGVRAPHPLQWISRRTEVTVLLPGALVHRRGIFTRYLAIVPRERIQMLRIKDGPMFRRLRTHALEISVAGNAVALESLPRDEALTLRDKLEHDASHGRRYRERDSWPRPALQAAPDPHGQPAQPASPQQWQPVSPQQWQPAPPQPASPQQWQSAPPRKQPPPPRAPQRSQPPRQQPHSPPEEP